MESDIYKVKRLDGELIDDYFETASREILSVNIIVTVMKCLF